MLELSDRIIVTNGFKSQWTGLYIGRPGKGKSGSVLANPYPLTDYSLEESLKLYKEWLWQHLQNTESPQFKEIKKLALKYALGRPIQLDCFCKPKSCHGDIIKSCVIWYASNKLDSGREFIQTTGDKLEPFIPGFSKQHYWRIYRNELSSIQWGRLIKEFKPVIGPFVQPIIEDI